MSRATKSFYRYVGDKRKTRENVGPLQKGTGALVTQNIKKAEVLPDFCLSLHCSVLQPHCPSSRGEDMKEEFIQNHV